MLGIGIGPTFGQRVAPGSAASIAQLFANGEQGGWYDLDFQYLFQDSAGTVPVTSYGQPVGRVTDRSGRGNHLIQATAASRPTVLQQDALYNYLAFDGVDDRMATIGNMNLSSSNKLTAGVAALKGDDTATRVLAEFSADIGANNGAFSFLVPPSAAATVQFLSKGTATATAQAAIAAPVRLVLLGQADIGADACSLKVNGGAASSVATDQGTGNYGSYALNIGARAGGGFPHNSAFYGMVVRAAASSAAEVNSIEQYLRSKCGAF